MATLISSFSVASAVRDFATREGGRRALIAIQNELLHEDSIELDFAGGTLTPSFADECIGGLAASLGIDEFKRRIHFANVPDSAKPLIRHVVIKRSQVAA